MKLIAFILMVSISLPGFGQEEDEGFYEELSEERLKNSHEANKINEVRHDIEEKTYSVAEELQKIGRQQLDYAALFDDKVQAILQQGLKESKIRKQSPEFIRAMIRGKVKGGPLEKVFTQFPLLLEICVDVMRDDHALPGLIRLFSRKKDLENYAMIWFVLLIAGYFLKKKIIPKELPFLRRFVSSLIFSCCMTGISLVIFYNMFKDEVGPTVNVILKHF